MPVVTPHLFGGGVLGKFAAGKNIVLLPLRGGTRPLPSESLGEVHGTHSILQILLMLHSNPL